MDSSPTLHGKKIILGITGCIAAYKSAELVRSLKKKGADVWVVMTESAQKFITPLTMRTLSQNPCITGLFNQNDVNMPLPHISLSDGADLFLVAPATANLIGKAANGIADDILTTLLLSCQAQKIFAPAMNTKMWENPLVQENIKKLRSFGIIFVEPIEGDLACGSLGKGKMASVEEIVSYVEKSISQSMSLRGKKILVTAGGTRESIDPVRFIGNKSSGKMGYQIALAAHRRGAKVKVISANKNLFEYLPLGIEIEYVESASQMEKEIKNNLSDYDVLIMAAAVSDYKVKNFSDKKIKRGSKSFVLELEPTNDILKSIQGQYNGKKIVGFCVETEDMDKNALKKLKEKGLDMIVLNDIRAFENDSSKAKIFLKDGRIIDLPFQSKFETANKLLDLLIEMS